MGPKNMNDQLIQKYLDGDTLPHERIEVIKWIETNDENRKQYKALRRLNDMVVWHTAKQPTEQRNARSLSHRMLQVAAVALLFLSIGGGFYLTRENRQHQLAVQTIVSPPGQRLELALSDGTKVWLNSNSSIELPVDMLKGDRSVVLNGEAYFEVAHDIDHPFVVKTDHYDVTVLGTTFNVSSWRGSNTFECSLIEGSVKIDNRFGTENTLLKPNEKVSMENGKLAKTLLNEHDDFIWRDGIYSFRNKSLSEVLHKLALLHEVEIEIQNPTIATQMCTGKFRNKEGIDYILSILGKSYQFKYKTDGEITRYIVY